MTNQELFELMARFEASPITGLKLSRGDCSLELSKGAVAQATAPLAEPALVSVAPVPAPTSAPQKEGHTLNAPLVGTYYAAPSPESAPYVVVGQEVQQGETVCLVEAMKMMNEVQAPCHCEIVELLCQDGELVGYDAPLLRYRPL